MYLRMYCVVDASNFFVVNVPIVCSLIHYARVYVQTLLALIDSPVLSIGRDDDGGQAVLCQFRTAALKLLSQMWPQLDPVAVPVLNRPYLATSTPLPIIDQVGSCLMLSC